MKTPTAVADWATLHVMEAHGYGRLKKSAPGIGQPCLESGCRLHGDSFFLLQKRRLGIKRDAAPEGTK
jgi:hypothetical protein